MTFAAALAVAKIPAGMILPAGERLTVEPFLPDASEAPTESLNDASAAFASRNKGYLVDHRAGVLTIEPRTPTPCSLAVRRRAPGVVFNGSLHEGLGSLFSAMNPSPSRVPHGLMGDSSIIPTLALKLDAQPLDELLGAVAQHRPGFVWLFREHQMKTGETVCVFEYFYEGYRISTPWYVPSKGR